MAAQPQQRGRARADGRHVQPLRDGRHQLHRVRDVRPAAADAAQDHRATDAAQPGQSEWNLIDLDIEISFEVAFNVF